MRGADLDNATSNTVPVGNNTEAETSADAGGLPFSISVDGEPVSGTTKPIDKKRRADLALEAVDIHVKFDGLETRTQLNVSTMPIRQAYQSGEEIDFLATSNYWHWIDRTEIRIYDEGKETADDPFEIVTVSRNGTAVWTMPSNGTKAFSYVLRVYDAKGRYDETKPLHLELSTAAFDQHEPQNASVAPGYSEDRTGPRNIPVFGGVVTVYGRNVPGDDSVMVMGEPVPVDPDGSFVVQRLLAPGDHSVSVALKDQSGKGLDFNRSINIPSNEWFYVGLADFTAGHRFGSKGIETAKSGEYDDVYYKGRLAFYLKGKVKGSTLITASADSGEDDIKNLFSGADSKDPRQFLRRIDPDRYYPVYGDDSTAIEDAPTQGKFYVRIDRGDSHVMWGNFKTLVTGTQFLRNERALYGANAVYRSEKISPRSAERRSEASVYAAKPGTLPQHDVLRGTGGSAYFLKHQDITIGSETVAVEIRDRVSGQLLEHRSLVYGQDYDINYVQGVILLRQPLPSTAASGGPLHDGGSGGNPVNLAVSYEFTPAASDVNGYVYGGRARQWVGDHLRVGVTGMNEKTGKADQQLYGADIRLHRSERTYLGGEIARSKGPGFGNSYSADGGLTIDDEPSAGKSDKLADAYRVNGHVGMDEITEGAVKGDVEGFYEHVQGGFSTLDQQVTDTKDSWGAKGDLQISKSVTAGGSYTDTRITGGKSDREAEAHLVVGLNEHWSISPGVRYNDRYDPLGEPGNNGSRTDVGGRLTYSPDKDHSVYVFGQGTVNRSGGRDNNHRGGVGGETRLTEKISLTGEGSYGTSGFGALGQINYRPTADNNYFVGYRLDPDRDSALDLPYSLSGDDLGAIIAGAHHRYSEHLSVFAEDSYDMFGERKTLAQTYGVTYTPDARWTLGGTAEMGTIEDSSVDPDTGLKNSNFDRTAIALSAGYKDESGVTARVKGEIRLEDSQDNTRDRNSYLFSAMAGMMTSDDWRLIANLDAVVSDASDSTLDGNYVESSLGFAYRPAKNDRFNALFKYTFLYDLPGIDQVTVNGTTVGPSQISHIMSVDGTYDLTEIVSIGGKYGFRIGETRPRDGSSNWETGSAHLGILRADLHIVKNWDALIEGRVLFTPESDSADSGALLAVHRHLGENFKLGIGYNFGRFSDDMRDLTHDDGGVFINAIGKF